MKINTFTTVFYWVFPAVVVAITGGILLGAVSLPPVWSRSQERILVNAGIPSPSPSDVRFETIAKGLIEEVANSPRPASPAMDSSLIYYHDDEVGIGFWYPSSWGPLIREPLKATVGKALAIYFSDEETPRMVFASRDFQESGIPFVFPNPYTGAPDPSCSTLPEVAPECEDFSHVLGVPARALTYIKMNEAHDFDEGNSYVRYVEARLPISYAGAAFGIHLYFQRDPYNHILPVYKRAMQKRFEEFKSMLRSLKLDQSFPSP